MNDIATETKTAIGNLLLRADPLSKQVLTAYEPSASRSNRMKALLKFNLSILEPCATFLNIELADDSDNKIYTKDTLVQRLLLVIESLLPTTCTECAELYAVELEPEEAPLFHCYICLQGSHNCLSIKRRHEFESTAPNPTPSGFVWLCHECCQQHNPTKPRKSKSRHVSVSQSQAPSRGGTDQVSTETPKSSGDVKIDQEELKKKLKNLAIDRICEKYKTGKCPHGLRGNKEVNGETCQDEHPKRCFKYCRSGDKGRFGCKKGKNCSYFHPALCKFSVTKRLCTNENCTFVHVKGTKRKAVEDVKPRPQMAPQHQVKSKGVSQSTPAQQKISPQKEIEGFLELKEMVQQMSSTFLGLQQEISAIRANQLLQKSPTFIHQFPLHSMGHTSSPMMGQSPSQMMAQSPMMGHQPTTAQTQFFQSYVPPSSC